KMQATQFDPSQGVNQVLHSIEALFEKAP
ncbi:MAG: hypothetical protein RI992_709, partial [Actinomycetota bacterium]